MLRPIFHYEIEGDKILDESIREAIDTAKKYKKRNPIIKFDFRGICISVDKDSDIQERMDFYYNKMEKYMKRRK